MVYFISGRLFSILDFFEMSSSCMSAFRLRLIWVSGFVLIHIVEFRMKWEGDVKPTHSERER